MKKQAEFSIGLPDYAGESSIFDLWDIFESFHGGQWDPIYAVMSRRDPDNVYGGELLAAKTLLQEILDGKYDKSIDDEDYEESYGEGSDHQDPRDAAQNWLPVITKIVQEHEAEIYADEDEESLVEKRVEVTPEIQAMVQRAKTTDWHQLDDERKELRKTLRTAIEDGKDTNEIRNMRYDFADLEAMYNYAAGNLGGSDEEQEQELIRMLQQNARERSAEKHASLKKKALSEEETEDGPEISDTHLNSVRDYVQAQLDAGKGTDTLGDDGFGYYDLILFNPPVTVHSNQIGKMKLGGAIYSVPGLGGHPKVEEFWTEEEALAAWEELQNKYSGHVSEEGVEEHAAFEDEEDEEIEESSEEFEPEEEFEPDESDAFIGDAGRKGYSVSIDGKWIGNTQDMAIAEQMIREKCNKDKYWPNVWFVSDHGNVYLIEDFDWEEGKVEEEASSSKLTPAEQREIHELEGSVKTAQEGSSDDVESFMLESLPAFLHELLDSSSSRFGTESASGASYRDWSIKRRERETETDVSIGNRRVGKSVDFKFFGDGHFNITRFKNGKEESFKKYDVSELGDEKAAEGWISDFVRDVVGPFFSRSGSSVKTSDLKLSDSDRRVIDSFVDKRADEGNKLDTDGRSLDCIWFGGRGIAKWVDDKIFINDLGSRSAQTVQHYLEKATPKSFWGGYMGISEERNSEIYKKYPKREMKSHVRVGADPSLQAPKRWFNSMKDKVKKSNPDYSADQVAKTIGKIWSDLSDAKKSEIRGREGKSYGPANGAARTAKALQYMETAKTEQEAQEMFEGLKMQDGYIGGRVLPPSNVVGKNTWRVQTFFEDESEIEDDSVFPEGVRRVVIPHGQEKVLGINSQKSEIPKGFKEVTHKVKVNKIDYIPGQGIDFVLTTNRNLYDDYLHDYIGSVSFGLEEEIDTFRNSGYTDEEIQAILDDLHTMHGTDMRAYDLPKPVTVPVIVLKNDYR